jgi:hypothetical protein
MLLVGYANRTFNGAAETVTDDRENNATHRRPRRQENCLMLGVSLPFSLAIRAGSSTSRKIGRVKKMRALLRHCARWSFTHTPCLLISQYPAARNLITRNLIIRLHQTISNDKSHELPAGGFSGQKQALLVLTEWLLDCMAEPHLLTSSESTWSNQLLLKPLAIIRGKSEPPPNCDSPFAHLRDRSP